ncbi:hypothetical protein FRB94_007826 [Tulasnella sp. JGI-2019a]|nr:hypothetical protein FRB94_007826 [Tulasnella sp. JGI-2019a]
MLVQGELGQRIQSGEHDSMSWTAVDTSYSHVMRRTSTPPFVLQIIDARAALALFRLDMRLDEDDEENAEQA